jgi:hypothetical protein
MGAYFLNEEVRTLGRLGCATCLLGSIMLVLHAPPDENIQTIDEILNLAIQPCMYHFCNPLRLDSNVCSQCSYFTALSSLAFPRT